MRKLILFISFLIFTVALQAQEKTYVYGKLDSFWTDSIELLTWEYFPVNTTYFDDKPDNWFTISSEVKPDSTFVISSDMVTAKYTMAEIRVEGGSSESVIILSPGDSLGILINGPAENIKIRFAGKGAGKNKYLSFEGDRLNGRVPFTDLPQDIDETALIDRVERFISSTKLSLDSSLLNGQIDSSFYHDMLRFNHYQVLSEVYLNTKVNDNLSDQFVNSIYDSIARIELNDVDAMSGLAYPRLIRAYPKVIASTKSEEYPKDLLSQMRIGQELFSGPIRTYFLYDLISESVSKAGTLKQKYITIGYIREHIDDNRALDIVSHIIGQRPKKDEKHSDWLTKIGVLVVGIMLMWIIIRSTIRSVKNTKPSDVKPQPSVLWIGFLIAAAIQFPALRLMIRHPIQEIWPQVSGALTIALSIFHGRVVSNFLLKGKYLMHIVWGIIISLVYVISLYLTLRNFGDWSIREINGLVLKWGVIATSAIWLNSIVAIYLIKLSEQNKDLRYLIQHIVDNLEFVIHSIIISGIFFLLASKLEQYQGIRDMIWYMTLLLIFYLVAFWLAPRYRFKQKIWTFRWLNVGIFIIAYLFLYLNTGLYNQAELKSIGVKIPLIEFFDYREFVFFFIGVSMLLGTIYAYLRKNYFRNININLNLYRKKEAELQQLRSQVNPHFLFNSLNTVYAQALKENSEQTAESIAKLSNLMRYLIEDMEQESIPIRKEIGYIHDYIRLQRVRSSVEHEITVDVELTDEQLELEITPMLMIPFVENAFKHGLNPNKKSRIKIRIYFEKERFNFEIRNSIDPDFEGFEKELGTGTGIANARKRMEYIYPYRHKLLIEDTESYYLVRLWIEI